MAFLATIVIGAAGIGFGASQLMSGMDDIPSAPDPVTPPDPMKAEQAAKAKLMDQRKILLATGGQTDYTSGTGVLTGTDVSKTTLLGG